MVAEKQLRSFISYSRVNKEFALRLAKELKASGFNIWLDQLDIPAGARWDDEIEKALEACDIFMVILTPASSASVNVKDEIGYAIDTQKHILPVLLENATIPLRLRRFQYVDFTMKSFDEGVESAKQLLKTFVEELSEPKEAPKAEPKIKIQNEGEIKKKEETERLDKPQSQTQVAQTNPKVEQKPTTGVETEPPHQQKTTRKPVTRPIIIGVSVLVVLVLCGIAGLILTRALNQPAAPTLSPSIEKKATSIAPKSNPTAQKSAPTQIPGPTILENTETKKLFESGNYMGIYQTAKTQHTETELEDMINAGQTIPVTLDNPGPIRIGYGWCATSSMTLYQNLTHIEFNYVFELKKVPDNQLFGRYYTTDDGWYCYEKIFMIDNWKTGDYNLYQEIVIKEKINDGKYDIEPYTSGARYKVTVP